MNKQNQQLVAKTTHKHLHSCELLLYVASTKTYASEPKFATARINDVTCHRVFQNICILANGSCM
jgi:hypothetical protein